MSNLINLNNQEHVTREQISDVAKLFGFDPNTTISINVDASGITVVQLVGKKTVTTHWHPERRRATSPRGAGEPYQFNA